ncbi:alanine racemase [Desulfacinum hydrothermale DSM 13146]|uniref:Alanine racemase n=1 Tax=Desulfacinum hydrothermale DSM 13146 TaxID=1121390 RepID=A0A1W1X9Y0_9BACT|nr:alanine racemase [Desulfacinum hydrothermale]SMC20478.1 alanine racemase [Desulfacinum hydrothermale DSM 13146]
MALNWVEIDLAALRHNFQQAKDRISKDTAILAVVKSDAYGHGMVPVARELAAMGARFFGVSKFWEAMALRDAHITQPILVLVGIEAQDCEDAIRLGIRPALYRLDHAQRLNDTARKLQTRAKVHVKVDTGMGRLGVPLSELESFLKGLGGFEHLEVEGVFSHFATADERDKHYSALQMERFSRALDLFRRHRVPFTYAHMANSAGTLDLPGAHHQLVRPGIMLYGSPPSHELHHPAHLKPVMSLKARVVQVKQVPQGHPIGYGRTFTAPQDMRLATVPVGYDDGLPRLLSNKGSVLIRGQRAPIVGRVSMNMITVDVSAIAEVREDDEVVVLGSQGSERITADEIAALCGTISYEIYCNVGKNPQRLFVNASAGLAS